ncbi:MAG: glycerol-3-phosphate dehydrogenase [Xanthobacteraceae bacterium]|nr:glycerol-3-phosphate dehydrogenase [Xanthobacteraceae bacterium]
MAQDNMADYDIAIIGGGINGTGIARDAAGRGLRVVLFEQNDLASGTSSASTKLIHGGLRYLEHGALRLVREALTEREVMLRMAPHLIRPMRFVLPAPPELRSPLLLRLGLFVYDHLGGRRILPGTRTLDLRDGELAAPLRQRVRFGFEYSDCWVDDARLVVLNAVDAAARGAVIRTRTRVVRAEREELWRVVVESRGRRDVVSARVLINAAGPWAGQVAENVLHDTARLPLRLDKGSHIVVPRLFDHDRAYILQTADRRVVFAIPYENDFTLVGTTDAGFTGELGAVTCSAEETEYLCGVVNDYFRKQLKPDDVVWSFAGVRSLYDDGASEAKDATRDYVLDLDDPLQGAPLLTVYGGKITTYRRLAEAALEEIEHLFKRRRNWTAKSRLPGGDFDHDGVDALVSQARRRWPFLTEAHALRLVRAYGTRVEQVLGNAPNLAALGPRFGGDLTGAEVLYLMTNEWAQTEDDVLWRRSKLGLRHTPAEREALARFMVESIGRAA